MRISGRVIRLPWGAALSALVEIGQLRNQYGFHMEALGEAEARLRLHQKERAAVRAARSLTKTPDREHLDVQEILSTNGFTRRMLKAFQIADLHKLISLPHGANFSVPGSGKTTVTLALHLITQQQSTHLMVVAPKNAFGAWDEVIEDCIDPYVSGARAEPFVRLEGDEKDVETSLYGGGSRFLISYDKLIRIPELLARYMSNHPVHLVLDESHRIKAGDASARGRALLGLAALPVRRDILTGTPAPNSRADISPQVDFLWPGMQLGRKVADSVRPRDVLSSLYVRTTKHQLGLPAPSRVFDHVEMGQAQLGLYSVLRRETIRQLSALKNSKSVDFIAARRSVMRLLQASTNPVAAALAMSTGASIGRDTGEELLSAVLDAGDSNKMHRAAALARQNAAEGRKTVIWTIFRDTIERLSVLMHDLSPVVLHGGIPTGADWDSGTREGRIKLFHDDLSTMVMIANPAACSEGISLHHVCHDAVYVDRSYNAAHYIQSVDRIHRLGLSPDTRTNIIILQSVAPERIGSIDHSVSRRLAVKMRIMDDILDDEDVRTMALDEEESEPPVDRDISMDDLLDVLEQLTSGRIPDKDVE